MAETASIVLYRDRLAIVGPTGSGKTELGLHFFETARCRRVLVDPKHSLRVRGVQPVYAVADVDWRAPIIHVRPPAWRDRDFARELYGEVFKRLRHVFVFTDEADGVSDSRWHGSSIPSVQAQGRELEIGHAALTTRPVDVDRELFTEATHFFVFPGLDDDDLKAVRRGFTGILSLERLRALVAELPYPGGYVWIDKRARKVRKGDPIPAHMRPGKLVSRRSAPA